MSRRWPKRHCEDCGTGMIQSRCPQNLADDAHSLRDTLPDGDIRKVIQEVLDFGYDSCNQCERILKEAIEPNRETRVTRGQAP
jgi:hypothetical protein